MISSSVETSFLRSLLNQKIGIAGTEDFESAPTLAAAAEENRCEYVPATDAGEPAAWPNKAEN